ncbi:MAG: DEAD/DEAH box helicase [Methylococcus sp.]
MNASDDAVRQPTLATYLALTPPDQSVINLLAVNWGPLTLSAIKTGLDIPAKNRLVLDAFLSQGLIVNRRFKRGGTTINGFACHPDIIETVARRLIVEKTFDLYVERARKAWPLLRSPHAPSKSAADDWMFESADQVMREVRIGLYRHDPAVVERVYENLTQHRHRYSYYYWGNDWNTVADPGSVYTRVCCNPYDSEWFGTLPAEMRKAALPQMMTQLALDWRLDETLYSSLSEHCRSLGIFPFGLVLADLLRGEPETVIAHLEQGETPQPPAIAVLGLLEFLRDQPDSAIKHFEEALRQHRRLTGQRKGFLPGITGVFYILALSLRNRGKDLDQAQTLSGLVQEWTSFAAANRLLRLGLAMEKDRTLGVDGYRLTLKSALSGASPDPWAAWIGLLNLHRYDGDPQAFLPYQALLQGMQERAETLGWAWLAAELGQLLARFEPGQVRLAEAAAAFRQRTGLKLLVDFVHYEAPWERALNAIRNSIPAPAASRPRAESTAAESRLAWLLAESYGHYSLECREQKRTGQSWTKGKPVSLKSLRESVDSRAYLSEQDRRVISHITLDPYTRGSTLSERGWLALVEHPAVFWADSGHPVELTAAPPELRVRQQGADQLCIEFWPKDGAERTLVKTREGLARLRLTALSPEQQNIARIIGDGIVAPNAARTRLLEDLGAAASLVAIHSDIGAPESASAETVPGDSLPRVQLAPEAGGLQVAVLVRPFGERGAYYPPGLGGVGLIAEIEGQRLQTQRDLSHERQRVIDLIRACPSLEDHADPERPFHWFMEDAETSLKLLLELDAAGPEMAAVEWPKGEKFKVVGQADLTRMSVQLKQQRDWFSVDGELRLDDGEVIRMQTLLALMAASPGQFVRLDETRFLALTESFRKRLEDLQAFTEAHGQGRRVHPLALPVLEELGEEFGEFKTDLAWRRRIEQLRDAERSQPVLPGTLQAELRDYQMEGYHWLSRLATWGVGACLADDMGLGKTVQAIALILSRAGEGPSLVIAPTSVTFNWHNEVSRFAPTLNLKSLTGDRQQLIDQLGPLDLLICSYGLLQQEAVGEALAGVRWRTLVLDEAQAIKNAATRRSQQAMALQADFKLITTGTPVENHLGELWNLFRFINPGLLGSLESFNRRFAGPIERNQDRGARLRLKRLIQPYILRRTKVQVLEELPPRTEIELQVELSAAEATFYEALRRNLLEQLDQAAGPI